GSTGAPNSAGGGAWGPSPGPVPGGGWTPPMMATAPAATATLASGATSSRLPPACDGSTSTGRWDIPFTMGTALMSRVLRYAVSNVRIPRSAMMICWLPSLYTYSAALSHSSTVAVKPRLSITGLGWRPTSVSNVKLAMLRV